MLTLWKYIVLLLPAGVLAGIASSVAGLASLVSYPALLFAGIPPVAANVTNTAALVLTAVGSGATSTRELHGHLRELLKLLPLTAGGSFCGSLLLLAAPAKSFEYAVPYFIFGSALLILWPEIRPRRQPAASGIKASGRRGWGAEVAVGAAVFVVGAYTGYFGAAGGVVMLAILTATSRLKFAECNALRNVSLGASNLTAAIVFAFRSHIYWQAALPLAAGLFVGGAIGPYIVRRVPSRPLKFAIAFAAVALSVFLFVQAYFPGS